jgi:hypothetical protein
MGDVYDRETDPEIDRAIAHAKAMRARGMPGFDVQNERWRCGTLRVFMGFDLKGRQIVHEYDMSRAPERAITGPADILGGCPMLARGAPGWKVAESQHGGSAFF